MVQEVLDQGVIKTYSQILEREFIVFHLDLDGKIIYVNENFSKKSGYSKEEMIGSVCSVFSHPKILNLYLDTIQKY